MATYQLMYTDTRFDDLSEEESRFKITELFKEGKLHLDIDKRVNMLSVSRLSIIEWQEYPNIDCFECSDNIINVLEIYSHDTNDDQGNADNVLLDRDRADKVLLDTVFLILKARSK